MSAAPLPSANSYAALPFDTPVRRLPRAPERKRTTDFTAAFDYQTLFYDCFRHADGQRVLMVGPAWVNLEAGYRLAKHRDRPGWLA